jgi:hypothetical protein
MSGLHEAIGRALSLLLPLAEPPRSPLPRTALARCRPGELRGDTRGAIMLTGLFMSCFLIGALWFVIGIGDTLVFRDKMQEATDHAAFASAALHAKGMNFISLCNLVLLAAVTIHIILGIMHDVALAICIVSFGTGCGYWGTVRQVYTTYFDVLKPAAKAIGVAEKVASYGFPVMGLAEGFQIGRKYGGGNNEVTVIPLSTSLLPGGVARGLGATSVRKEGLPVEQKEMSLLCKKIASLSIGALLSQAMGSDSDGGGQVVDMVKSIIGGVLELRYCNDLGGASNRLSQGKLVDRFNTGNDAIKKENKRNDTNVAMVPIGGGSGGSGGGSAGGGGNSNSGGVDPGFDKFWGEKAPMIVYGAAANGNEWFQTYALNFQPRFQDDSESKVGIARGPKQGMSKYTKTEKPIGYFTQSEFYFDCEKKWTEAGCNYEYNATFQIKWRARLRRLSVPNITSMLAGMGAEILFNLPQYDQFKKVQGSMGTDANKIFGGGVIGRAGLLGFMDVFTRQAEAAVRSGIGDATKGLTPTLNGVYH